MKITKVVVSIICVCLISFALEFESFVSSERNSGRFVFLLFFFVVDVSVESRIENVFFLVVVCLSSVVVV